MEATKHMYLKAKSKFVTTGKREFEETLNLVANGRWAAVLLGFT